MPLAQATVPAPALHLARSVLSPCNTAEYLHALKMPQLSSGSNTTPSTQTQMPTPTAPSALPSVVEHPQASFDEPPNTAEGLRPVPPYEDPSDSSDEQGSPSRAIIRAWAKATPAGPPRMTPSPTGSAPLTNSSSDNGFDRTSVTRSTGRQTVSTPSQRSESGSRFPSRGDLPFADGSSGSAADVDSSGSSSSKDNRSSPSAHPPYPPGQAPLAPAPLQPLPRRRSPLVHASSSESSLHPTLLILHAHQQEQQDCLDRRAQRHLHGHHSLRRRQRRPRAPNPTPPGSSQGAGLARTFDPRLPFPPMRPLRPLQLTSGGVDVFEEIGRMLATSRRSPVRAVANAGGSVEQGGRGDDVLEDIFFMIHQGG